MATSITERPYTYSFSENEIRYLLTVTDPDAAGCEIQVEIYTRSIGGTAAKLTGFSLYPGADGIIYCHIKSYLKSILEPQLPNAAGATVQAVSSQVAYFYIKYREVTTALPDPTWQSDESNERVALIGGVEQQAFKRNNFFVSYLATNKTFLTWRPNKDNFVFIDQVHFLTFLLTAVTASITVKVTTYFTDGTSLVTTSAKTVGNDILFHIKAGAKGLGLDALDITKKLWYYEVSVLAADNTVLANPKPFYIEYKPVYAYNEFNYFNSLGGWDSLRIMGDTLWSLDINADDVEHVVYNDSFASNTPQPQYSQANIYKKDNYKGDAGWQRSKLLQEVLVELLISKNIVELRDERWIKIINLKKTTDMRFSGDKKWSFPVEWSYGYSDAVFTPKGLSLGPGS